jgi:hypothetical protein
MKTETGGSMSEKYQMLIMGILVFYIYSPEYMCLLIYGKLNGYGAAGSGGEVDGWKTG